MEVKDELRVALLDADVAQILQTILADLAPGVVEDDALYTAERLLAWQAESGLSFAGIARVVRLVRGNPGYQREAAQFSRQQSFRRNGIDQFRFGIAIHSRRLLDRWGWVLAAYLSDVQEFALTEALRQGNGECLQSAKATILRARTAGLKVIEALSSEQLLKAPPAQPTTRLSASVRRHSFERASQTNEPIRQFVAAGNALLKHRDAIKNAIPDHLVTRDAVVRISSITSLRQQVAAYNEILRADNARLRNQERRQVLADFDRRLSDAMRDTRKEFSHPIPTTRRPSF